jgi:carbamoyltransferase
MFDEPRVPLTPAECAYTGIEYPDINEGIPYDKKVIAKMLADSKIIAWFDGGSEFGPRALGHRSFLANPCDPKMKDVLNSRVKHREWFRPFAPIVVKERVMDWFDIPVESPYMLYTAPVKQPWKVPSITHIDGTARVQTLDREMNEKVYDLILELEKHTGVPIVLNTSLNVNGQPIVETPQEALDLFHNSDIDAIVINNRMLIK